MNKGNYDYLKKFVPGNSGVNDNWFLPVSNDEVLAAEKKLGGKFPEELIRFYSEIGFGMLRAPIDPQNGYRSSCNNEILPPHIAVDYSQGIIEHPDGRYYMSSEFYDDMEENDLPFLEISDSSMFMTMKLKSINPNAVWFMGQDKIEDSFERFIWRTYHEGPGYYSKNW